MSTPQQSGRVVHTGQVVMDLALRLEAVPQAGGDVFAEDAGMHVGGGYNVLFAARRLGVDAVYAGALGSGPFSDAARTGLAAIGVAHTGPTLDGDLGYCVAITDGRAERTFISTRGAETRNPVGAYDALELRPEDVLYITGYSLAHDENLAALERLIDRLLGEAGEAPCRTVFDVSPMVETVAMAAIERVGELRPLWSVNEREAAILARRLGLAPGEPPALADALADRLGEVLVRVGPGGAWYARGSGPARRIPTIAVTAIDTNGAGDAHAGVLCAALARGESLETALRWANVAGALSTTRIGPATCPGEAEIRAAAAG